MQKKDFLLEKEQYTRRVVLMSLQGTKFEMSPARYQLMDEMNNRGYETYVFLNRHVNNKKSFQYVQQFINTNEMSVRDIRKKIIGIRPQAVIATTYEDTEVLYPLPWVMKQTSFYYYNLEIYTSYLYKDIRKQMPYYYYSYKIKYPVNKLKEIVYTKKIKMFTIQDDIRRKVSARHFIRHKNTLLIPNTYCYDVLNEIQGGKSGIIYSGGVTREFLLTQFKNLKNVKNVSVTFAGRIDQWCRQEAGKLKRTNPNIIFNEQSRSPDEHTEFLKNYAVGLVWYSPSMKDEANYYIGLSSGKMFKHLSLGQPVIAVKAPGITQIVNKYKLGIVIDDISKLESAYYSIMGNYSDYRQRVLNVFKSKFDFRKVIIPFLDYIEKNIV